MLDHPSWHNQPYQEVVVEDVYRLRGRPAPATIYDCGANRGCFAAFCHDLWPTAQVVSVEPHPDNYRLWMESAGTLPNCHCLNAAIGTGPIYFLEGAGHGNHTYTSANVGHSVEALERRTSVTAIEPISLDGLVARFPPAGLYYVKLDIEAAEESLFEHEPSNAVLRGAAYWAAELHFFAAEGRKVPPGPHPGIMGTHGHVIREALDWAYSFTETHAVELLLRTNAGMLWATQKGA